MDGACWARERTWTIPAASPERRVMVLYRCVQERARGVLSSDINRRRDDCVMEKAFRAEIGKAVGIA